MKFLDRILGEGVRVFTLIGGFALVAMMAHITLDVIMKALFATPVPATMEATSYYYMTAVVMLPLAALERQGNLVYVELFYERFGRGTQFWIHLLALAVGAAYCLTVAYAAWSPAVRAWRVGAYAGSLTRIDVWPTRFLPIAGFGLLGVVLAWKCLTIAVGGSQTLVQREHQSSAEGPH